MSQHLQHHHQHPQYVHYTGPPGTQIQSQVINGTTGVSIQDPAHHKHQQHQQQQQQQQQQQGAGSSTPLVATGDWTKDLVHLAKTAELKKHALTLQLHTAHILSAHASLEQKSKTIQDIREQKNKLESERTRLLNCLREINEDRDKADLLEASIDKECNDIRVKITQLTDGEYAIAKRDVDRLRQELGQAPLPSLQSTLDEKTSQYLNERRLNGNEAQSQLQSQSQPANPAGGSSGPNTNGSATTAKRAAGEIAQMDGQPGAGKRPRGRPKGSKNRAKAAGPGSGTPGGTL